MPARRLPLLLLFTLALAAPAGAQETARKPMQIPKATPMRKAEPATPAAVPVPILPTARVFATPIPVASESAQCRSTCARTYYLCLTQDDGQDCAPRWGQCAARCGLPG